MTERSPLPGRTDGERPSHGPGRDVVLLVLLWVVVTVPYLGKAFHIDDPVHVLQAEHIVAHPAQPLALEIFWFEWPEWLANSNPVTPPVWPYELAAAGSLFGSADEEVLQGLAALHLLLLAIALYVLAARLLEMPTLAAALVLTSPAAVVGRNVMLDIPMLSYLVAGMAAMVAGTEDGRRGLCVGGALLVGIASVTKLPAIAGVPAVAAYLVSARRTHQLSILALAVLPLGLWYVYQLAASGGIDILRPRGGGGFFPQHSMRTSIEIAIGHLPFWGGTVFTGHAFVAALVVWRRAWAGALILAAVAATLVAAHAGVSVEAPLVLRMVFFLGGLGLLFGAVTGARHLWAGGACHRQLAVLLTLWMLGHVGFVVAGAWEMNVRLALLSAVPASLLCLAAVERLATDGTSCWSWRVPFPQLLAIGLGTIVSMLVGWADAEWAHGYRQVARLIATSHPHERVWFVGHWGFQHYATARGLAPYIPRDDRLAPGDLLVIPFNAARQRIPDAVMERLTVLERHEIVPTLPLRTMTGGGGFYSTGWGPVPWGWSREPADVVVVTRYE